MSTNLKLNSVDLADIFSSAIGNTDYSEYSGINILDKFQGSNDTIKGTENVNYSVNGTDFATIFHPKYNDSTVNNSSTDISIPSWCNKVGFVLQGGGGKGGGIFTNYWQKYNIPQDNTSYGRSYSRTYGRTSYDSGTFISSRDWRSSYRFGTSPCNTCDRHTYSRSQTSTQTSYQNTAQTQYDFVTYFRNGVEYKDYNGSSGAGGGCGSGLYTIDPNNRIDKFTFITNDSLGYEQIYFSNNEYAIANNGGDVVSNSQTYTAIIPMMMNNSDLDNTTTDTIGSAGAASVITNGRITSIYTNNGSNGNPTTGNSSIPSGGNSGIKNDSIIEQHFLPIFADTYGSGSDGSTGSSSSKPNNHILRYWFIR